MLFIRLFDHKPSLAKYAYFIDEYAKLLKRQKDIEVCLNQCHIINT